jgi:hypothetical protein
MRETRILYHSDVRTLCMKHNWYTLGDNMAYVKLLEYVVKIGFNDGHVTTENIVYIATDILAHSETEYTLESICFEVATICRSHFTPVADDERVDFSNLSYSELREYLEKERRTA